MKLISQNNGKHKLYAEEENKEKGIELNFLIPISLQPDGVNL